MRRSGVVYSADVLTSQKAIATAAATNDVGVCGDCERTLICDDVDDVWGTHECGICNGPGAIYECGCSDIPTVVD